MNGSLILRQRPRFYGRIDRLISLTLTLAFIALVGAAALFHYFHCRDDDKSAATMIVALLGISTFLFTVAHARILKTVEVMDTMVGLLRHCWSELRKDEVLLAVVAGPTLPTEPKDTLRLRCYLAVVVDSCSLINYYIRHGYTRRRTDIYAAVYENTVKAFFRPHVPRLLWKQDLCLQREYDTTTQELVNSLILEVEAETAESRATPGT